MAGWERHNNWPSLISLRCLHERKVRAFITASLAEGLSVSLFFFLLATFRPMMNGCGDGLLPRESSWRAWAKPWMMNNDSVAISPQEVLRLQSALLQRKSGWQAYFNQGPNPIMARCGSILLSECETSPHWDRIHHLIKAWATKSASAIEEKEQSSGWAELLTKD